MEELCRKKLEKGTILDGRYAIQRVLGEGGFGVTYLGFNQRVGISVAIKEFHMEDQGNRKRIMKEARILGKFSGMEDIAGVIDYFEENGAAYIVMEYVDGQTLRQYVRENGRMDAEKIFRMLFPLMKTLESIHSKGVLHRDITPDNLMVLPGDKLKLIDFGSARADSLMSEVTGTVAVKKGYAPAEQYTDREKQGPWTDIYALCATLYECITGRMPQEAFQRLLYDELEMPSEMGIVIDERLEGILEKGLRLKPEERYASMKEMLADAEQVLTPKKEKRREMKWLSAAIAITGIFCILTAGLFYIRTHPKLRFQGKVTETILFGPDEEMTAKGWQEAKTAIADKMRILAGEGNYVLKDRKDGSLEVTAPLDSFRKKEISALCRSYFTRPVRLMAYDYQALDSAKLCAISQEDIREVSWKLGTVDGVDREERELPAEGDYYYLVLKLSEEKGKETQNLADEKGRLWMAWDMDVSESFVSIEWKRFLVLSAGDGTTFYMVSKEQEEVQQELAIYNLTHPSLEAALSFTYEIPAEWESAEMGGAYQCNVTDVEKDSVCVVYTAGERMWEAQRRDIISGIKIRLDALEIPYAVGTLENDENSFVIRTKKKDLYKEVMWSLGEGYEPIKISDTWGVVAGESAITDVEVVQEEGGTYALRVSLTKYEESQLEEKRAKTEEKEWYLMLKGSRIARCRLEEDIEDGTLLFRNLCSYGNPPITDETVGILRFVRAMLIETELSVSSRASAFSMTDEEGNIEWVNEEKIPSMELGRERKEGIREKMEEHFPEVSVEEYARYPYSPGLKVRLSGEFPDFPADYMEKVEAIYEMCELGDGFYGSLQFIWDDAEKAGRVECSLTKDSYSRKMKGYIRLAGDSLSYLEELKKLEQKSAFWKEIIDMGMQDSMNE